MKYNLHKLMAMFIASIFAVGAFAQTDVTSQYLQNADFSQVSDQSGNTINVPTGWTVKHVTGGWLDGFINADGQYNFWAGSITSLEMYQTVNLPAGKYTLSADFFYDATDGYRQVYASVNGKVFESPSAVKDTWNRVGVTFINPEQGDVVLGIKSNGWFKVDDVKLEFLGVVSKDDYLNEYNQTLETAQALANKKMSVASATLLESIIAEYGSLTADNSIEELEGATDAILEGIEPVKASINSYEILAAGALPDNRLEGWTCTNSNTFHINTWSSEGNSDGSGMVTPFIENWVGSADVLGNGKISYTLPGVDPGYYKASSLIRVYSEANNEISGASFFANDVKTDFATGKPFTYNNMKGIYDVYTAVVNVGEDGVLEFGVEIDGATFNWVAFKNVKLEYIGIIDQAAAEALKAKIPTTKYDAALSTEIATLVAAVDAGVTYENYLALSEKVALAEASAAAYATNKLAIDAMFSLIESTNVYTAEAFLAYKSIADDYKNQYEAGTLTATIDNPASVHGWHASVDYDDMLLSAFGVKDFDTSLYINTWSNEGANDGSGFTVPFFEYWTGDDNYLEPTTKTATVTGLKPGKWYSVEAWVRVRAKNDVAAANATGITLSVGEGEVVDITEGEVIDSHFSHGVFTAYGVADAEGNLAINFNVLDGNNVSWLAFKNLKYAPVFPERSTAAAPKYYTIASYNRGGVLTDVNGAAQHIAANENSYWYFTVANANGGVNICNLNGNYLNEDLTIGETETPAVWYILPNGVNENGLSISKTNPISDRSCVDANNSNTGVGTWHPSANDWDGTTWVFAEFDCVKEIEEHLAANAENHAEVPAFGQYTTKAYEVLAAAKDEVSNPAEALAAIKNFEKAKNLPVFTINGVISYAAGKSIYDEPGNVNDKGNTHYFKATDATDMTMLWALDMTETEVGVVESVGIHNVGTGAGFWGCPTIKITETEEANEEDGIFLFYTTDNGSPIHAQDVGQLICRYGDKKATSGSAWTFTYVGSTYELYDLSEVYLAFEAQAMEFMAFGEGNMALYQLQALKAEYDEVMMSVQELYGQIYAGAMVLKADVVAAMELMTTTKAKVESVAAYYSEDYNAAWFDANAVLDLIGEEAEEYDALVEATNVATVTTVAELEAKVAVIEAVVAELCGIEEVYPAFEEKLMELMSVGEGNMALYRLSAVQAQVVEVMTAANEIYGVVSEGGLVLKSEVVAVTELMDATLAEVKPVLAYYSEAYNAAWFDANAVLDLIGEEAEEYDALVEATNVATVTTVAELEEKVNVIKPIVAKYCGIEDVYPAFVAKLMELMSVGEGNMALYSLPAVQAQVVEVMTAANEIYGVVSEGGLVLKSEVVAVTELMDATLSEVKPVLAYYTETYSDIYWSAIDLLDSLDPESIEWANLDDAIGQVYDLSEVTTVAELEAKVAILKAAMDEITVTGINNIDADADAVIYDLSGRRVEKAVKGIYIVNGKKVFVK